jgi:hypothetical protein
MANAHPASRAFLFWCHLFVPLSQQSGRAAIAITKTSTSWRAFLGDAGAAVAFANMRLIVRRSRPNETALAAT